MGKTVEFSSRSVLAVQLPKIAYARWSYDAGHIIGVHFRICGAGDFFPIGWPIVKLISLGRYPSKGMWFQDTPESNWTMGLGIAAAVIVMMVALHQFRPP